MRMHKQQSKARAAERGSALLIAIMVTAILTLLGLSYLTLADQENAIAVNQRDSDQLLWVAEAGAKMVKAWFDRPVVGDPNTPLFKFMGDYDLRSVSFYDRTQRRFDHDNDPNTPEVLADGTSSKPYFRQGLQVSADPNYLSFWCKPYRGSAAAEFRGLETGPDIVMESNSTSLDFMDILNQRVIGDRATQEAVGRIQKIEVFSPPIIEVNGVRTRYGIATVKVTASKFRRMSQVGLVPVTTSSSLEVGRRQVKMVLNETPYPAPGGPFTSCTDFGVQGCALLIHWGEIASGTSATIHPPVQFLDNTHRSVPWASPERYLDPNLLAAWVTANNGATDGNFDPWWKLRAGGAIDPNALTAEGAPNPGGVQPWPYVPISTPSNDNTALFQWSPTTCPKFDYSTWKQIALSGGQDIHYMTYVSQDLYQENGVGPSRSVHDWTDGEEGFWFFDTTDGLPPDPNGTNLTPEIHMMGDWVSSGFIFLSGDWESGGVGNSLSGFGDRVLIPPGEPWNDADGDGVADPGEYVNLEYPTSLAGGFKVWAPGDPNAQQTATATSPNGVVYTYTTDPNARDDQGLPFNEYINFQGIIYTEGTWRMNGAIFIFGAVITNGGIEAGTPTSGTPDVYFDERLIKDEWPPPELNIPRTAITFWQTDM